MVQNYMEEKKKTCKPTNYNNQSAELYVSKDYTQTSTAHSQQAQHAPVFIIQMQEEEKVHSILFVDVSK